MHRIYYIVLAGALVSSPACHTAAPAPVENKETSTCIINGGLKPLIKLTSLTEAPVNRELELTGSVSYDQDHLYRYQSLASGVVKDVKFNLGDFVTQGQVLGELKTTELSGQSADLLKAEARLTLDELKL